MSFHDANKVFNIVVLPGDGVGPEVTRYAMDLLETLSSLSHFSFRFEQINCGGKYYLEHGREWDEGSFEKCRAADAILLGAVGYTHNGKSVYTKIGQPYAEPQLAGYAPLIGNRQNLNLFANVRPVKLYPGLKIKTVNRLLNIWQSDEVNYVILKENTEDAYTGQSMRINNCMLTPIVITKNKTERFIRFAFNYLLKENREYICCVDKSNIIPSHRFFREIFTYLAKQEFPNVPIQYFYADTFTYEQNCNPSQFDVVVAPNLIGDIISENAVFAQGGLGFAPSANIGERHAMFEPIHGSALDIAGKNKVNPIGMLLSVALMLEWLAGQHKLPELREFANILQNSVAKVTMDGSLTEDATITEFAVSSSELYFNIKEEFIKFLKT